MPNHYRLKGSSLEEIRRKAVAQHGPAARVVSAERVSSPGIAGLFAGQRYEAVVEVRPEAAVVSGEVLPEPELLEPDVSLNGPDGEGRGRRTPHHLERSAIAALLEQADTEESRNHVSSTAPVSTASADFDGLLAQLGAEFTVPAGARGDQNGNPAPAEGQGGSHFRREAVPAVLGGAGDLVLLVGLGRDAIDAAVAMSIARGGADVRTAGALNAYGHLHIDGRLSATSARAQAVLTGQTLLVAFGVSSASDVEDKLPVIRSIAADQAWLVVDAGRKPEDTAAWVGKVTAVQPIDALAVCGVSQTLTPSTVNGLGIPVGWVDGGAPERPFL